MTITVFVLEVLMLGIVCCTLVTNTLTAIKEGAELKRQGKTPLTGRNLTTVIVAAVAEYIFVLFIGFLVAAIITEPLGMVLGLVTFLAMYVGRNGAAYLSAWGLWSLFVRLDKRKMEKQVQKDKSQEGAL